MFERILILITAYFLIGALILFFINSKKGGTGKEKWTKFVFYFFIVYGILLFGNYLASYFYLLALCIAFIGYSEIIANGKGAAGNNFVFRALFFYTLVIIGFVYFSYVSDTSQILWLYTLVLTFDGFSQLVGQLVGQRKIAKNISPNKTWEGALGGIFITLLTAYMLKPLFLSTVPVWLYHTFVVAICIFAFVSDLLASYYKRRVHVKDYSRLIPGHGGVLDRFDSFIGAACVFILFLYLLEKTG